MNRTFTVVAAFFCVLISCNLRCSAKAAEELVLSPAEQEWIEKHPRIHVANEMDWPPFDFNESDTPKGFAIDYIKLLARKAKLEIDFVYGHSWGELVELFRQKKIDVMPVFYKNKERETYTLYSSPYYRCKLAVFVNSETSDATMDLAGKRVGMETSHGSIPIVKKKFPGINIVEIPYKEELVKQLATRKLDAVIGNPFVFYYHARENQIVNIRLADYIDMSQEEQGNTSLHVGVHKSNPMLHQVLQKAIDSVSESELEAIKKKWMDVSIVNKVDWSLLVKLSLSVVLVIGLLLCHNRWLKSTIKRKTLELQQLNESLEEKIDQRTQQLTELNTELKKSLEEIRTLRGIIPICSSCKKIRDDEGFWNMFEAYISKHSDAEFSHGLCPNCARDLYPELLSKDELDQLPTDTFDNG